MKVLVIGCGSIGSRHVRNLRALGADVGVFDANMDAARRRLEDIGALRLFASLPQAFTWAEAAVIATPAAHHLEHLATALAASLPTFVEKPLALSADPVLRDLAGVSERAGVPVLVGYNLRYHELWASLRRAVHDGAVGIPDRGEFCIASNMATWPGRAYADALAECSHEIDQALWMFGPGACVGAITRDEGHAWDLLLRHDSGATSSVHINGLAQYAARSAAVAGSMNLAGFAWDGDCGKDEMYVREMEHFLAVATKATHPRCTLADGLAVLCIMDQARRLAS